MEQPSFSLVSVVMVMIGDFVFLTPVPHRVPFAEQII